MEYVPDNYDQWKTHDAEQEIKLEQLPRCSECGKPIQDDFCYEINDEYICEKCLTDNHRKLTEDVMVW